MIHATEIKAGRVRVISPQKKLRHSLKRHGDREPVLADLVRSMIAQCPDPARLLELYYWSQEPQLTNVMRALIALPNETRARLQTFLATAPNLGEISAAARRSGRITLSV